MVIMTHAKFHFNWLMLTLIFGIWASEPPRPGERLKRPGLIGLTWQVRGLYELCHICDVQYFYRMKEEQLILYFIFTKIKMHKYGKQSTLSHKETISTTCCHHSIVKVFSNF